MPDDQVRSNENEGNGNGKKHLHQGIPRMITSVLVVIISAENVEGFETLIQSCLSRACWFAGCWEPAALLD